MGLLRQLRDRTLAGDVRWLDTDPDGRVAEYATRAHNLDITVTSLRRQNGHHQETIRQMTAELSDLRARCTTAEAKAARDTGGPTVPAELFDNLAHLVATARTLTELRVDARKLGVIQ